MRNKTGEGIERKKSINASVARGTRGRAEHKNGAKSTNKPSGGKMAR